MQNEKICEFNKLTPHSLPSSHSLPLLSHSLSLLLSLSLPSYCSMRQHVIWPIAVDLALKRISLDVAASKDGDALLNVLDVLDVLDAPNIVDVVNRRHIFCTQFMLMTCKWQNFLLLLLLFFFVSSSFFASGFCVRRIMRRKEAVEEETDSRPAGQSEERERERKNWDDSGRKYTQSS